MLLDIDAFKEKVYRRTQSQSSVDAYMNSVVKLEQFAKERIGTDLKGLLDQLESKRLDTYNTLDRFVGWATALESENLRDSLLSPIINDV